MTQEGLQVEGRDARFSASAISLSLWVVYALWLLAAASLAIVLQPQPSGDWAYYWNASTAPSGYLRGGPSIYLLAPFKLAGAEPWLGALLLNSVVAAWMLFAADRLDSTRHRIPTLLIVAYLMLLAPFASIVQVDMIAAGWLVAAIWFGTRLEARGGVANAIAVVVFLGLTGATRTQYFLVFLAMAGLLLPCAFVLSKGARRPLLALAGLLLLGASLGAALDFASRSLAGNSGQLRTGLGVTLYTGLLNSSSSGGWCGGWTPDAYAMAQEDADLSLPAAVAKRLQQKDVSHWRDVVLCKSKRILLSEPYAWDWLVGAEGTRSRLEQDPQLAARFSGVGQSYGVAFGWVRSLCMLLLLAGIGLGIARRDWLGALLLAAWVLGFWCVHGLLEVQGRYFLGMVLAIPFLYAVLAGRRQWTSLHATRRLSAGMEYRVRFMSFVAEHKAGLTLAAGLTLSWAVAAWWLASTFQPAPISDWEYYWYAASALGDYHRGGLALLALAVPKALGFEPWQSALLLNVVAVLGLALVCNHVDGTRYRLPTVLMWCYLFLLVPYAGIVQLDMMAAAALAVAIVAGRAFLLRGSARAAVVMVLALVFATSTRTQYSLVLLAFTALLVPFVLIRARRARVASLLALIALGAVLGGAVDSTWRSKAGNAGSFRTGLGVTLYTGLLASTTDPWTCGTWSLNGTQAAAEDLELTLPQAIQKRLAEHDSGHWLNVVKCKTRQIVLSEPYAWYWFSEAPIAKEKLAADAFFAPRMDKVATWYTKTYKATRTLALLLVMVTVVVALRRRALLSAAIPLAWMASFWCVHVALEIQGRYFLGMLLLAPLFCAVVWTGLRAGGPGGALKPADDATEGAAARDPARAPG